MKLNSTRTIRVMNVFVLLLFVGCGKAKVSGRPDLFKVTGSVTCDEKRVEGATVVFIPEGHSHAAVGITDSNGLFQLQTYDPGDGVAKGSYKVTVTKSYYEDDVEHHLLPSPYAAANRSGLTADVDDGENHFDLKLMK